MPCFGFIQLGSLDYKFYRKVVPFKAEELGLALVVKNSPANIGEKKNVDSIPGMGRSPGGNNPLQLFLPGESHGQRSLAGP